MRADWTYHFILTNAEDQGDIVVSDSPTIYTRATSGALHIYFNLPKNGTPSVTVEDVVPEAAAAEIVLTLSHCVDGGVVGDDDETPVTFNVDLVEVWTVDDDPDGLFVEGVASATLAAEVVSGLSHGDADTVTEADVDTGHELCSVTGTAGLGEQTVDGTVAVDGIITHTVTNTVTCQAVETDDADVEEEETEVLGEIEGDMPETEVPMTDRTVVPQPSAVRAPGAAPAMVPGRWAAQAPVNRCRSLARIVR